MGLKSICLKCNVLCINKNSCDKLNFVKKTNDSWNNKGVNQKRIINY